MRVVLAHSVRTVLFLVLAGSTQIIDFNKLWHEIRVDSRVTQIIQVRPPYLDVVLKGLTTALDFNILYEERRDIEHSNNLRAKDSLRMNPYAILSIARSASMENGGFHKLTTRVRDSAQC